MIILQSTDSLSVVTSAIASIDVHASWIDNIAGTVTPGRTNTATISTATTTTIVAAPAASTYRNLKSLAVRNRHASTSCDITLKHTDGTNNLELIKTTLAAGEELIYFEGFGFTQYLASGAIKGSFNPAVVGITGGTIAGTDITTIAGTSLLAGLHFPTGVVTTSPIAGDLEYDGVVHYGTPVVSERGVLLEEQIIALTANYTLANQTAAQAMFNAPANGRVTVGANRTYMFDWLFDLSSMSASSGAFGIALAGTANVSFGHYDTTGNKATLATAAAPQCTYNSGALSNTAIVTATTATVGWAKVRGILRFTTGGTLIPQVSLGVAAAAVVTRDSYFRIRPYGTNLMQSVGNWS